MTTAVLKRRTWTAHVPFRLSFFLFPRTLDQVVKGSFYEIGWLAKQMRLNTRAGGPTGGGEGS